MNFSKLHGFVKHAVESDNPFLKYQGMATQREMMNSQEDEDIPVPELEQPSSLENSQDQAREPEDMIFQQALKEMYLPDTSDNSTFGKVETNQGNNEEATIPLPKLATSCWDVLQKKASAYVRDIAVKDLPAGVKAEVSRFASGRNSRVIQYGMVVKELLPKVDKINFEQALTNAKSEMRGKSKNILKMLFFKKAKNKYVLMVNDRVVDGHHFIAKAQLLGITSSLRVLDLTPTRFQKKATVLDVLKEKYGSHNHCR